MIEKQYKDIRLMLQEIRKHVEEFNTYVISNDDMYKPNVGWYCPSNNLYFCTRSFRQYWAPQNQSDDAFYQSIYDHKSVRDELSIYLSNCATKEEYERRSRPRR